MTFYVNCVKILYVIAHLKLYFVKGDNMSQEKKLLECVEEEFGIKSLEDFEKVLYVISHASQELFRIKFKIGFGFFFNKKVNSRDYKKAKSEFLASMGVLMLEKTSKISKRKLRAIGEMTGTFYRFNIKSWNNQESKQFFDAKLLSQIIETLTPEEKKIWQLRLGVTDGRKKTYKQIGEIVGYSPRWVSEIYNKAVRKIFGRYYALMKQK